MKTIKIILSTLLIFSLIGWAYYESKNIEVNRLTTELRVKQGGTYAELSSGFTHFELSGNRNNELVVLVHGFSSPSYIWYPTEEFLINSGYQVLSYDLYGRGFSDRPDVIYGIDTFTKQLNELLIYLKIREPFHLLGLSMGGSIVTGFTHRHPKKVKSLILQDPLVNQVPTEKISPLHIPFIGEYLFNVYLLPEYLKKHVNQTDKGEPYSTWGDRYQEQAEIIGFKRGLLSSIRYVTTHDYENEYLLLSKVTVPKLLIWGSDDQTIPISEAQSITHLMPEMQFETIQGAGHVPSLETPEKFNHILLQWLINHKS